MHLLLQLSLACSIIAGCSTQTIPPHCLRLRCCLYKGKWYEPGSEFQDECNDCWCNNGRVGCTRIDCGNKPGVCPEPGIGLCWEECSSDRVCPYEKKCCFNGCGHTCEQPNN